jgi:hypothetical protein
MGRGENEGRALAFGKQKFKTARIERRQVAFLCNFYRLIAAHGMIPNRSGTQWTPPKPPDQPCCP